MLDPERLEQLREIAIQIFLAGEPFRADPLDPRGFLGVQFSQLDVLWHSDGVTIQDRIPGFRDRQPASPGNHPIAFEICQSVEAQRPVPVRREPADAVARQPQE